jgi:pyruvate formate lyase activating enzyme
LDEGRVRCRLCPHSCLLKPGQSGNCLVRRNEGGTLVSLIYNQATAIALDPIEKKPLYHFHPGKEILSIGTSGCNLHCSFCQNWEISQTVERQMVPLAHKSLLDEIRKSGSIGLAYTYSEPAVWIETVLELGKRVKEAGFANVLVTNGFIEKEPLEDLLEVTDAMNVDLKAFTGRFYSQVCKGRLEPVKENIALIHDRIHLELTTLVIPGLNDSEEEIDALCKWVANLDPFIPLHFSRYHPAYKMETPATPESTLKRIYEQARTYLKYVYAGNVWIPGTEDTYCPHCGAKVISRAFFTSENLGIREGQCRFCGHRLERMISDYK